MCCFLVCVERAVSNPLAELLGFFSFGFGTDFMESILAADSMDMIGIDSMDVGVV